MRFLKHAALALCAFAVYGGTAKAADLASAEPVEYVKVCDAYGVGYFFIPGSSDTCLRISGYVRAYIAYQGRNTANDQTRGAARAQGGDGFGNGVVSDTVGPSLVVGNAGGGAVTVISPNGFAPGASVNNFALYGVVNPNTLNAAALANGGNLVVRGNSELRDQYESSIRALLRFDARTKTEFGILRSFFEFAANSNNSAKNGDPLLVRYAIVQFGPITAGITESFAAYDLSESSLSPIGDRSTRVPTFVYTASLGNGLSVTFGAEDSAVIAGFGGQGTAIASGGASAWTRRSVQLPTGVANVRLAQSWGNVQVSASVDQLRFANTACTLSVTGVCTANKVGWSVRGGTTINLPFITKGDTFLVEGVYAEGTLNNLGNVQNRGYFGNGVAGLDNTVSTQSGWAVFSQFKHYFTPAVEGVVFGGYTRVSGNPTAAFGGNFATFRDGYYLGGRLFWTPVAGLQIGTEIFYQGLTYNFFGGPALGNRVLARAGDDNWGGFFRIQRSF